MAAKSTSRGVITANANQTINGISSPTAKYQSAIYVTRLPSGVSITADTTGNQPRRLDNNVIVATSPTTGDHLRRQVHRSSSKNYDCGEACTRRLFHRHEFRRPETERIYLAYAFRSRFVDIRALGILLTALFLSLAIVDFVCAARPTIDSVTNVGLGATTSVLLVVLHTRLVTRGRLPLVAAAMVCVCLVFASSSMLPVSRRTSRALPAEGVWRLCYVILAVAVLVPLPCYVTVGVTTIMCVAHGSVAVLTAVDGYPGLISRQVIANTLLMFGVLMVGTSIHDRRERVHRKLFTAIRQCTATGLRIQDERSKMERLLASVVPQHLVAGNDSKLDSLCRRLPLAAVGGANRASSARPQSHDCVRYLDAILWNRVSPVKLSKDQKYNSEITTHINETTKYGFQLQLVAIPTPQKTMLFADVVGLSNLSTHSSPSELVQMLNELFGRFDQLATENHCTRVQLLGDGYYAVCGIPDVRPDHAKCCVELGLDLIDVISFLRDSTEANIGIRVGVHSGPVECGVIGLTRWRFDVWSSDTCLAEQMVQTGLPGFLYCDIGILYVCLRDIIRSNITDLDENMRWAVECRVHVTEVTMDHLHGEFDAESGRGDERSEHLRSQRIRTYLIVFDHPRKLYGPLKQSTSASGSSMTSSLGGASTRHSYAGARQSLKNMSSLIARLVSSSVRFNADIPFANVFPQLVSSGAQNNTPKDCVPAGGSADTPLLCNGGLNDTTPHSRLDKHLWLAVNSGFIDKSKIKTINCLTLCFKGYSTEYEYKNQCDKSFPASMLYSLILLAMSVAVQALVLPRTLLLLLLFLISFAWMSVLLMLFLGYRIKCTKYDIRRSWHVRLALTSVTLLLVASVSLVNVMCCRGGRLFPSSVTDPYWGFAPNGNNRPPGVAVVAPVGAANSVISFNRDQHLTCDVPHYVHLAAILSLSSVVVFKMAAAGRLAFLMLIAAAYVIIVEFIERPIFTQLDQASIIPEVPTDVAGLFMMFHFVAALYVISRHDEWTRRLLFLWSKQSVDQQHELTDIELENDRLLTNILPRHVIPFFTTAKQHTKEMYCENYNKVIVGFASIANFYDSEFVKNAAFRRRQGLRLLNDVITSFDELLEEHRFVGVDKIKTVGNVYMFVVGLKPHHMIEEMDSSIHHSMATAIQFSAAMTDKLFHVNESFTLRVGIDLGSAVAGVVGARKPQFDIWGSCVNTARDLERTGLVNTVNITCDLFKMVQSRFQFQCRGPTRIKPGSGINDGASSEVTTFFLPLDSGRRMLPPSALDPCDRIGASPASGGKSTSAAVRKTGSTSTPTSLPCVVQSCASTNVVGHTPPQMTGAHGGLHRSSSTSSSRDVSLHPPPRISMTPPSSLGRRRRGPPDVAGTGSTNGDQVRMGPSTVSQTASGGNGGGNFLAVQPTVSGGGEFISDGGRSPDLPVVHFRNFNISQGGAIANIGVSGGLSTSCGVWGMNDGVLRMENNGRSSDVTPRPPVDGVARQHSAEETSRKNASGSASSGRLAAHSDSDVCHSAATTSGHGGGSLQHLGSSTRSNAIGGQAMLPCIAEAEPVMKINSLSDNHEDVYSAVLNKQDLDAIMRDLLTGESNIQNQATPLTRKTSDQRPTSASTSRHAFVAAEQRSTPNYGVVTKNNSGHGISADRRSANCSAPVNHSSETVTCDMRSAQSSGAVLGIGGRQGMNQSKNIPSSVSSSPAAASRRVGNNAPITSRDLDRTRSDITKGESKLSPPPLPPPPPAAAVAKNAASSSPCSSSKQSGRDSQPKQLINNRNGYAVPVIVLGGQQRASAFRPVLRNSNNNFHRPLPQHWMAASSALYRHPLHQQQQQQPQQQQQLSQHQQLLLQVPKYLIDREQQRNQRQPAGMVPNVDVNSRQPAPATSSAAAFAGGGRRGLQHHQGAALSSFRVRRASGVNSLNRLCRSLDNLASDVDDCTPQSGSSSRADSPSAEASTGASRNGLYQRRHNYQQYGHLAAAGCTFLHPDDVSLSSFDGTGSEMSRSDPALSSYESAYGASCGGGFESEYDNYRPGMASDEDYFVPEPISDVDIDMFDDDDFLGNGNTMDDIENVTVSETYPTAAWSLASSG